MRRGSAYFFISLIRTFILFKAPTSSGAVPLTLESITKHDARLSYAGGDGAVATAATVNDIAMSLKSFNFGDDAADESQYGTFKTFQTFASSYSACSNMTFNKLVPNNTL